MEKSVASPVRNVVNGQLHRILQVRVLQRIHKLPTEILKVLRLLLTLHPRKNPNLLANVDIWRKKGWKLQVTHSLQNRKLHWNHSLHTNRNRFLSSGSPIRRSKRLRLNRNCFWGNHCLRLKHWQWKSITHLFKLLQFLNSNLISLNLKRFRNRFPRKRSPSLSSKNPPVVSIELNALASYVHLNQKQQLSQAPVQLSSSSLRNTEQNSQKKNVHICNSRFSKPLLLKRALKSIGPRFVKSFLKLLKRTINIYGRDMKL